MKKLPLAWGLLCMFLAGTDLQAVLDHTYKSVLGWPWWIRLGIFLVNGIFWSVKSLKE